MEIFKNFRFLYTGSKTDGLFVIRVIVGLWIAWYGKDVFIPEWFEERRLSWGPTGLGFSHPETVLYISKTSEIIFGILLALGLFTRLSSFVLLIIMSVAISVGQDWQILPYQKGEIAFFYGLFFIVFLFIGGGRCSLDWLLFGRNKPIFSH